MSSDKLYKMRPCKKDTMEDVVLLLDRRHDRKAIYKCANSLKIWISRNTTQGPNHGRTLKRVAHTRALLRCYLFKQQTHWVGEGELCRPWAAKKSTTAKAGAALPIPCPYTRDSCTHVCRILLASRTAGKQIRRNGL